MFVDRTPNYPNGLPEETPEAIEAATCKSIKDALDFFRRTDVRVGEEGVYFQAGSYVYLLSVDIKFVRKVDDSEEIPKLLGD